MRQKVKSEQPLTFSKQDIKSFKRAFNSCANGRHNGGNAPHLHGALFVRTAGIPCIQSLSDSSPVR